jgi:DHA2 family multidrug resistance protein
VALPHIAGTLSASTDESTWVLTSYLVANAIMLPAAGWIARRIGRKRLLMISILVFTGASLLCGVAVDMPMLIVARVLQGIGGGGMQPLAQSILLESFPPRKHGTAMAVYGMGIVVAPVIGPTLGGWITDSYSWRWIFYINLPVGLLALYMANLFIEDPPYLRQKFKGAIDYLGFGLMAVWLGSLQLVLDKGQEADWFEANWIRVVTVICAAAFVGFVVRELTSPEPIVQLRILLNRNFAVGTAITTIFGFSLYGVTALLPLFLQTVMGYSALDSGMAVSPRGLGSLVAMMLVGILVNYVDGRILLAAGIAGFAYSTFLLSHINLSISMGSVAVPNFINGFAGGFIFVPLTTMTMSRLRKQEIGNAAGVYNLMRNIGGSIGISIVNTVVARHEQVHRVELSGHLNHANTSFEQLLNGTTALTARMGGSQLQAYELIDRVLGQQARLRAYVDDFQYIAAVCFLCVPIVFLLRKAIAKKGAISAAH